MQASGPEVLGRDDDPTASKWDIFNSDFQADLGLCFKYCSSRQTCLSLYSAIGGEGSRPLWGRQGIRVEVRGHHLAGGPP